MISESTLNAIDPIVDLLYADRVNVVPHPRSILATLTAASKSAAFTMGNDNKDSFIDTWVSDMTEDTLGNKDNTEIDGTTYIPRSLHTATVEEAANAIFTATLNAVSFVRGTVIPQIMGAVQAVKEISDEAYRPVEDWEIVEAKFLPLWNHNIIKSIVSECKRDDGVLPNLRAGLDYQLPIPPAEDKFSEFQSGNSKLDDAFFKALSEIGLDLKTLYQTVFGQGGKIGPIRHALEMRNLALCQLLMVWMIEDKPWEGCGLTSTEWDHTIAIAKAGLSKSVAIYREIGELNQKDDLLIQDIDPKTHRIYVESDVYSEWLDENDANTPELLIGLALMNEGGVFSKDNARELMTSALSAWQSYHASKQQACESNRLSIQRSAIMAALVTLVNGMNNDDLPPSTTRVNIIDALTERVRNLTVDETVDMAALLIDLVCNTVYRHTSCYNLASRYLSVTQNEPNLTKEDAELKVVMEYIADFASAQLVIGKI